MRVQVLACGLGLIWSAVPANAQSVGETGATGLMDTGVDAPPTAAIVEPERLRRAAHGAASVDPPTAAVIIERALEVASRQRDSALGGHFEYLTVGTVESLDAVGNVTRTETSRRRHYPLEGHFYSELIGRDGRSLDAGDARDEWRRKAEFVREARRHAARGVRYDPDEMHVEFDSKLMERYDTTLVGEDVVRGEACWVVRFEPRPGRLPDDRRIDKALNRSTGHLWITRDDYRVTRVTFEMQRPFRWLWGIAGTLRHATGQFDLQWIQPNLWGLADSRIEFDLGVLFGMKSTRRRVRSEWIPPSGRRPVDAVAGLP